MTTAPWNVDAPHSYEIEYSEGDHRLQVMIDLRDTVPLLCRSEIRAWNPPHDGEVISEEKRSEIMDRVLGFLLGPDKWRQVEVVLGSSRCEIYDRKRLLRERRG
jgi:hypothetical protein